MRVVVTGANRGIGLEITRQLAQRGDEVHATARDPERAQALRALASEHGVHVHPLDVRDDASVRAFAASLGDAPLDLLLNNAGIASPWESLDAFDPEVAKNVFDTNAVGTMRVTLALLPMLRKAKGKVFHMTSRMGSIADNTSGGSYGYRMAKAALNMAGATLALDLKGAGVASILLHPGWVKTDMGGPSATLDVATSASRLVALMDRLGLAETGRFYAHDGAELPW